MRSKLGLGRGCRVIDLAAGTGKLTRLLVDAGVEVIAVEPTEGMRRVLEEALPTIEAVDGTAESIPLGDSSADLVTVAQAFHWFDRPAALAEIARVLRPGGGLALLWNERDDDVPWVAAMTEIMNESFEASGAAPYERDIDYAAAIEASAKFGPVSYEAFRFEQLMDADLLVERALSSSYMAVRPPDVQEDAARRLRDVVAPLGREFGLPYRTDVFWCTRS